LSIPWEERGKKKKEGLAPLLNAPLSGDGVGLALKDLLRLDGWI